jgi:hypothetical protein
MAAPHFSTPFHDTNHIVIPYAEHGLSLARWLGCGVELWAPQPDGTRVSLAADYTGGTYATDGTLTLDLLTRRSGVVDLWP